MSVTTGTKGATATPATDLYNILATALALNANWAQPTDHTISSANAGTTAGCEVWKNTGGVADFFVCFEIDDTNARLRVRAAETFEGVAAQWKIRQPAGSGGTLATTSDGTSVAPTANGTVTDSDITWGSTNPNVEYKQVNTSAGGYSYLYEVRNHMLTFATRSGSANTFAVVGEFTSLVQSVSDSHPLFLMGHDFNNTPYTAGASASGGVWFSRTPNSTTSSSPGSFAGQVNPLHLFIDTTAASDNADVPTGYNNTTPAKYFSNYFVSPAILHGSHSASVDTARAFRGYLTDFIATRIGAGGAEPPVGDTVVVAGTTYYWLGVVLAQGAGAATNRSIIVALKA